MYHITAGPNEVFEERNHSEIGLEEAKRRVLRRKAATLLDEAYAEYDFEKLCAVVHHLLIERRPS